VSPDTIDLDALLQRCFRYALSLVHDHGLAEDLVQDACVRASRDGGPWRAPALMQVIRHRFIDHYRRQQKIKFHPLEDGEAFAPEADRAGADDELAWALGQLRPEERELIYLAVVEEYSAREVAELTGKPRGTVLSAVYRAKQKLRRVLDEVQARDAS